MSAVSRGTLKIGCEYLDLKLDALCFKPRLQMSNFELRSWSGIWDLNINTRGKYSPQRYLFETIEWFWIDLESASEIDLEFGGRNVFCFQVLKGSLIPSWVEWWAGCWSKKYTYPPLSKVKLLRTAREIDKGYSVKTKKRYTYLPPSPWAHS